MNSYQVSRVPPNAVGRDSVVGDVHGCFRTLECALAALAFDGSRDRLFGVGDLVNRGPHSAEAINWIERRFTVVTLGNHDVAAFGWLTDKLEESEGKLDGWLRSIPSDDYGRWIDAFRGMPLAVTIETQDRDVGVVHAEAPHHCWTKALELLESGYGLDVALLEFPHNEATRHHDRTGPVEGVPSARAWPPSRRRSGAHREPMQHRHWCRHPATQPPKDSRAECPRIAHMDIRRRRGLRVRAQGVNFLR